jgi:hypothetical protein
VLLNFDLGNSRKAPQPPQAIKSHVSVPCYHHEVINADTASPSFPRSAFQVAHPLPVAISSALNQSLRILLWYYILEHLWRLASCRAAST